MAEAIWAIQLTWATISAAGAIDLGLMYLAGLAAPRGRHFASRRRPTWTDSVLYHSLGIQNLPADTGELERVRLNGSGRYASLAKLTRFTRATVAPGRTVRIVRAATPSEEDL